MYVCFHVHWAQVSGWTASIKVQTLYVHAKDRETACNICTIICSNTSSCSSCVALLWIVRYAFVHKKNTHTHIKKTEQHIFNVTKRILFPAVPRTRALCYGSGTLKRNGGINKTVPSYPLVVFGVSISHGVTYHIIPWTFIYISKHKPHENTATMRDASSIW